jgi:hypothetical protein
MQPINKWFMHWFKTKIPLQILQRDLNRSF